MPYTYNTLSNVTVGSVLTASDYNDALENIGNYRVPPLCVTTGINTSQTLTHASSTNLQFTGADSHDTDDIHNPSSNSDQFIAKTAGIYAVSGSLIINSTGVTQMGLSITRNDSNVVQTGSASPVWQSAARLGVSALVVCAANDVVTLSVYQESSGSANRNPFGGNMSMVWVGQVS
jgi:hypothetical protein